jgi:prepilin-type N-terminal cleavage/methylation domain-containing protein
MTQTPILKIRTSGFTLVELLVSITIIAVLAALVFAITGGIKRQAAATRDASTLRQMWAGILMYAADRNDLMPGPLFTGQSPVYNNKPSSNPREWRRLSDCLAPYLGHENPEKGDLVEGMAASWQITPDRQSIGAYRMQHDLPVGDGDTTDSPWGRPAPASGEDRMPMTYGAVMSQPQASRTWAMTELDQMHPAVSENPDPRLPDGMAHGRYRLGVFFDGTVQKLNVNNDPF